MKIIADVDFGKDDDKKEFGTDDKVVRIYRFRKDERHCVSFSFELGRKDADTILLTFELGELLTAIISCEED